MVKPQNARDLQSVLVGLEAAVGGDAGGEFQLAVPVSPQYNVGISNVDC